jgi:hypothetical protein
MGCVLQPGDEVPDHALKPGQTTSDAVQPSTEIDLCPPDGPVFALTINDFVQNTSGSDPSTGFDPKMLAGIELQNNGYVWRYEDEDSNDGFDSVTQVFPFEQYIEPKQVAADQIVQVYARASQTGGSGTLGFGSSPLDVWRTITGPLGGLENMLLLMVSDAGTPFDDWLGTIELSRDQVIIEDSATITLTCTQTGP